MSADQSSFVVRPYSKNPLQQSIITLGWVRSGKTLNTQKNSHFQIVFNYIGIIELRKKNIFTWYSLVQLSDNSMWTTLRFCLRYVWHSMSGYKQSKYIDDILNKLKSRKRMPEPTSCRGE